MRQRTSVVLLATFVSAGAWAQDVSGFSTTIAHFSQQNTPGFPSVDLAPFTEFLGVDATRLGSDALSLHLYGWGVNDLGGPSTILGKSGGDLSYAYLDYRFSQANAEFKAGRFSVNQGAGVEQVDGISGRTDLRGGFNVSAFVGAPVHYKTQEPPSPSTYTYHYQTDMIIGGRLGLRLGPVGEVGVSYLQDGSSPPWDLATPPPVDYTRKQAGTDLRLAPTAKLELTGHTLFNVANQYQAPGGPVPDGHRVAEQDYTLRYTLLPTITVTGNYTERNLEAYFAGTNMPNLFRTDVSDRHQAVGGSVILGSATATEVVLDFRHMSRETYGNSDRYGADLRMAAAESKVKYGFGLHKVSAADLFMPGGSVRAFYGMSREEGRAWVMVEAGKYTASLDGISYHFDDGTNPNLNGKSSLCQVVGSVGVKPTENLSLSGDLSYGANAYYQNETSVLLRTTYRFSAASKGGSK